ncbi:MAG TPA: outer membrane protein assembly factor BamD [Candidatus Acidoferrum sp.]|nr:outer membrane protein assembly factor BamD [Candidatus Acidoferrum sp.]
MPWIARLGAGIGLVVALSLAGAATCNAQFIFHKKKKVNKSTNADNNAQPDRLLYDRAMDDIKHGRHEVGRLSLQTLINTYPDSEYLAKAKLGMADSYYKEGGTSNLTLAISAYKDFIVFFPFLPEATYAQMQVAMGHFRQMEKPDRDRTEALSAEEEFQTFLQKYPNDPLAPKAKQYLREVQEVLAEGDYRIGYFYYVKGDKRAAATRLMVVTSRYPLYSKSDQALWMMGEIFEKSEHKEVATRYYTRIVKDYPLSSLVPDAKQKLKEEGAPVPQPDPTALAWMTAEQDAPRPHTSLIRKPLGLLKSGPTAELRAAAVTGAPNLEPETDTLAGGELLTPGGGINLGSGTTTGIVATVSPGGTGASGAASSTETVAPTANEGGADVGTVGGSAATADPPGGSNAAAAATADPAAPASATPATTGSSANSDAAKTDPPADANAKSDATASADKTGDVANNGGSKSTKDSKNKKESSSKKKGVHKLIPW